MTENVPDKCRWDREQDAYVTPDGEQCETPEGDHCRSRRSCSVHVGWGELICARCVHRVRYAVGHIANYSALLMPAALESRRIDSEAANLAGPAADVEAWVWRKLAAMQGRAWHLSQDEPDESFHPYTVLTRWAGIVSEVYEHPQPAAWTITAAAGYLDRQLSTVAADRRVDFPRMYRQVTKCREHLDAALRLREFTQRGVPCPRCHEAGHSVRLEREYAHFCKESSCQRRHVTTDKEDRWVCPRDREHAWSHAAYSKWLEERRAG